jgi:hypothetical protein
VNVPPAVGVPVIAPDELIPHPGGKFPETIDHTLGGEVVDGFEVS